MGLPIMAYNNPFDTKVDLTPDLVAGWPQIEKSLRSRSSPATCAASSRSRSCRDIDVIAGADDVLFETLLMGAVGWFAGFPNAFPKEAVELVRPRASRQVEEARALYEPLVAVFRWDSRTEFVQAIKLSHGHLRPVRRSDPAAAQAADPRAARTGHRGHRRPWPLAALPRIGAVTCVRTFTAVDSHTEGMPTRVITGGVGVDPGCDDERAAAALHRPPRPHPAAPDERAARPLVDVRRDPAAAVPVRRGLRRGLHRGQRMPADVRSRHDRAWRRSWSRPAWSR